MRKLALTTILIALMGCVAEGERGVPFTPKRVLEHPDDSPLLRAESVSVAFKANGEICTKDADCSTNYCAKQSETGELRCYGDKDTNETCLTSFDCRGGACMPTSWPPSESGPRVCVHADIRCHARGLSSDCVALAYQTCAYGRACLGLSGSFDACVDSACEDIWRRMGTDDAARCHSLLATPGTPGCEN